MRATKWMAVAVAVIGAMVMACWHLGLQGGLTLIEGTASMKYATALSFLLSGGALVLMTLRESDARDVTASICLFVLVVVMMTSAVCSLWGLPSPFDFIAISRQYDSLSQTVAPGRPSTCTMLQFLGFAVGAFAGLLRHPRISATLGGVVAVGGLAEMGGYAVGSAPLFCYFEAESTAMALYTAALFVFLGIGLFWESVAAPKVRIA